MVRLFPVKSNKHSSFVRKSVNYRHKKLCNIGPRSRGGPGSDFRLDMMSPSEANFDEAALEAELEALHMSRYKLNVILYKQSLQIFVINNGTLRLKN
jgi:hypothetical protein